MVASRKWERFAELRVREIKRRVKETRAINALSGGVDSSVVTVLGHRALGKQLRTVWIDTGQMREDEDKRVVATFEKLGVPVRVVRASSRFFEALKGAADPEKKRKKFRDTFYKVLGDEVRKWKADFLLQGTIKADILETQRGVKTQHNILEQIGLDPEKGYGFLVIEPIKSLFKPEVREVAKALGLPEHVHQAMPFPGPGLATRIVGEVTRRRVEVVRTACAIVENETRRFRPFQAFAVSLTDRATGLGPKGERAFGEIVVVRSVESKDAMTAGVTKLPWPTLMRIQRRICEEIPSVTKVLYDITPKPPSTIEYV
jgi:GMP synthase (glutamine-hydrolysing)